MRLRFIATSLVLLTAFACESSTEPTTLHDAAGLYVLDSVTGRGPVSGSFMLTTDGRAERRIRYATQPGEYVASGTFEVTAPQIVFSLHEEGTVASYEWIVRGELNGRSFSIHYPDPADGPDIVETYRR
jgi:hypothetical protein